MRYKQRLRARAMVRNRVLRFGFARDYPPYTAPAESVGARLIPAPAHQLRAQARHISMRRQAQQLYSSTLADDDGLPDDDGDDVPSDDDVTDDSSMPPGSKPSSPEQDNDETATMNEQTLWIPPAIMGVAFLLTLVVLLGMPVDARPRFGLLLLLGFAVALNTAIVPPITSAILQWNNNRTVRRNLLSAAQRQELRSKRHF